MASVIGPILTTLFGLAMVGVGLKLGKQGYDQRRRADRIAEIDTTDVRDLQPGLVEVHGTVRPVDDGGTHRAPISDADAVASEVEVTRKAGRNWRRIHENRRSDPFVVDDGTGEVRVEPTADAWLGLAEREIEVEPREEAPRDVERFAEESGLVEEEGRSMVDSGTRLNARYRFREGVLEPGEETYVLGTAVEEAEEWGDRRFVLTGEDAELVVSDKPEGALVEDERKQGLLRLGFGAFVALFGLAAIVLPLSGAGTFYV